MTDITELAQRMKAAAVRAKAATKDYVAHRMSITVYLEECKEFNDLSDGPDNILALVEALEKALQERENWRTSFDNERFRADKLAATLSDEIEQAANVRGQLLIAHKTLLNQQAKIAELEEAMGG